MAKLNQIIAVEKGIKSKAHASISNLHNLVQKPTLFNGMAKTYQASNDVGGNLPPENQHVQHSADDILSEVRKQKTELYQITARKDYTNQVAKADVVLDNGTVILKDAPVSFLLFLEKELIDISTLIKKLPELDSADKWEKDANDGLFKTGVVKTHRSVQVPKVIVKYEATDKHPAQTELIQIAEIVGYWNLVKHSGAIPTKRKEQLLERAEILLRAIKQSRELANMTDEVKVGNAGEAVFGFLFAE